MEANIEINKMRIYARHGVMPQENTVGNVFEITIKLITRIENEAYENDKLGGTTNYADLIAIIKREATIPSALLENVAYRIKTAILAKYPAISHGTVKIAKLLPPVANLEIESVAIELGW